MSPDCATHGRAFTECVAEVEGWARAVRERIEDRIRVIGVCPLCHRQKDHAQTCPMVEIPEGIKCTTP